MVEDAADGVGRLMLADISKVSEDLFKRLEVGGVDGALDDSFLE